LNAEAVVIAAVSVEGDLVAERVREIQRDARVRLADADIAAGAVDVAAARRPNADGAGVDLRRCDGAAADVGGRDAAVGDLRARDRARVYVVCRYGDVRDHVPADGCAGDRLRDLRAQGEGAADQLLAWRDLGVGGRAVAIVDGDAEIQGLEGRRVDHVAKIQIRRVRGRTRSWRSGYASAVADEDAEFACRDRDGLRLRVEGRAAGRARVEAEGHGAVDRAAPADELAAGVGDAALVAHQSWDRIRYGECSGEGEK